MKNTFTLLCGALLLCLVCCKREAAIVPESQDQSKTLKTAAVTPQLVAGKKNESGFVNGVGNAARFNNIYDLFVDGDGSIYVCDYNNAAIRKISIYNRVTTLNISADYFDDPEYGNGPRSVAVLNNGNVGAQSQNGIVLYKNGAVTKYFPHFETFGTGSFGSIDEGHDGTYFNFITNSVNVPAEQYSSRLGVIKSSAITGELKTISSTKNAFTLEANSNSTKYVAISGRLFKVTSSATTELYPSFNPNATISDVAVNKAGTEIYIIIDYDGTIKRIKNNTLETIISGVNAKAIVLANSENYLYYASSDNTVNRILLP
ncbi:hypothetical protein IM792_03320 [Mucilaginibacter sp. JRF]|uniref:hypothetical protein n=1 Tax=Mucilaginibacter sp. JRF TaxID=2780088 RepID=UPI00187F1025|nr:hypothetical protein [Mucilaginibacter sp. JRF]MBE9583467.1 hypothetical protein [Mucilaginibacter sp. JRF]